MGREAHTCLTAALDATAKSCTTGMSQKEMNLLNEVTQTFLKRYSLLEPAPVLA